MPYSDRPSSPLSPMKPSHPRSRRRTHRWPHRRRPHLRHAAPRRAAPLGAGSYATTRPAGAAAPVACAGVSANPRLYVTANAPAGAVPTNDWWSSLLYKRDNVGCQYSAPLHAHPMSFQPAADGLGVSYTTTAAISGTPTGVGEYHYPYSARLHPRRRRAQLARRQGRRLDRLDRHAVLVRRRPHAAGHHRTRPAVRLRPGHRRQRPLTFPSAPAVWANSGNRVGFTMRGHDYVAFAPTGATWTVSGTTITSTLAGRGYFSVALLPTTPARRPPSAPRWPTATPTYAHRHVTGTTVSWGFNQATSTVNATYAFTTTAREGTGSGTVVCALPAPVEEPRRRHPDHADLRLRARADADAGRRLLVHHRHPVQRRAARGPGRRRRRPAPTWPPSAAASTRSPTATRWPGSATTPTGPARGSAGPPGSPRSPTSSAAPRSATGCSPRSVTRLTDWFTASPGKTAARLRVRRRLGHAGRLPGLVRLRHRAQRPPLPLRLLHRRGRHAGPVRPRVGAQSASTAAWSTC